MNSLNDRCLLIIFKMIHFNDRVKVLRLVNKKFKELVDSIQIKEQLIIYDRMPMIPFGKLKYTGKVYGLEDSVYVTDLNKFFDQYGKNIKKIKTLVIKSVNQGVHDFKIYLNNLEHLELYSITFRTCHLIKSSKLNNLYHEEAFFEEKIKNLNVTQLKNVTIAPEQFISIESNLQSIDYLNLNRDLNDMASQLLALCLIKSKKLNVVKSLQIGPCRSSLITSIANEFKNIKRIDWFVNLNYEPGIRYSPENTLFKRTDLKINLLGIDPLKASFHFLNQFFNEFEEHILTNHLGITLIIHDSMLRSIETNYDLKHLTRFFEFVTIVSAFGLTVNQNVFKKLNNVTELIVTLMDTKMDNFKSCIDYFPNLTGFKFYQQPFVQLDDYAIKLNGLVNLKLIQKLKICVWQLIDLNFLVDMKYLKCLVILLYNPIEDLFVLNLIKKLKNLAFLQILFKKSESANSRNDLSNFKKRVISFVSKELKYQKFDFIVQILDDSLIRYTFKRPQYIEEYFVYGIKEEKKDIKEWIKKAIAVRSD